MKQCLVDANVFLPLLANRHVHHEIARRWFDDLDVGGAALCRVVQLALIRLLGNRAVFGTDAVSASVAWDMIAELLDDERVEFVAEPGSLDLTLPKLLRYPVPTRQLVGDAYLASFAIAASMRLVSFDKGFEQFRDVDLALLI